MESNIRILSLVLLLIATLSQSLAQEKLENGLEYQALEVVGKSPTELLEMRGFRSKVHLVRTRDNYYVHLVRVINPMLPDGPNKRPVIFNHGLMESSTIFLVNSRDARPQDLSDCRESLEFAYSSNDTFYRSGPMMLANYGYDVWLLSMRGTDLTLVHQTKDIHGPDFWNYSLDDFEIYDVPATISYVRKLTKADKIGYVGHSQATFVALALLANQPHYSKILEPVVLVAPVAYLSNSFSVARLIAMFDAMMKQRGIYVAFPPAAPVLRQILTKFCKGDVSSFLCQLVNMLGSGKGEEWLKGYYNHFPFYSSLKVLHHFVQLVNSKKFQRYDYGMLKNLKIYGQAKPPKHPVEEINSEAISLIYSKSDSLANVKDIQRFKNRLTVPLYREIYISKTKFNHFDLLFGIDADELVFKPMLEIFETFEANNGVCSLNTVEEDESYPKKDDYYYH